MQHRTLRWLAPALVGLALLVGSVVPASAAWNYEPVKWHHYSSARPGPFSFAGSFFVDDTTWVSAGAAKADTTAAWNMLETEPSPTGTISIGGATADSSQVGA